MVAITSKRDKQRWTIEHLSNEPRAAQYIHDDHWDASTLGSTQSLQFHLSAKNSTTILRRGGEPTEIIISVGRELSVSRKVLQKIVRAIKLLIFYFRRKSKSSKVSRADTAEYNDLDLGQNGVLV